MSCAVVNHIYMCHIYANGYFFHEIALNSTGS